MFIHRWCSIVEIWARHLKPANAVLSMLVTVPPPPPKETTGQAAHRSVDGGLEQYESCWIAVTPNYSYSDST